MGAAMRCLRIKGERARGLPGACPCALIASCLGVLPLVACRSDETPAVTPARNVRPVRVLLAETKNAVRVRIDGAYELQDDTGAVLVAGRELPWTEVRADAGVKFGDREPVSGPLVLRPVEGQAVRVVAPGGAADETRRYLGAIVFSQRSNGELRVRNDVDIEAYVAGVVACEAWPGFQPAALEAQAIAARTYVLFLMSRRHERLYDLRAGEGAQVYRGQRTDAFGKDAAEAAEATRALVLAHATEDGLRIFCAYYAAACGGRSQGYADVRHEPGPAPLCGGVACDDCRIASGKAYRWGPAKIGKRKLLARLKDRDDRFARWSKIAKVEVAELTVHGRIRAVRLISSKGTRVTMTGERFRLAVGSRVMRSTDCRLVDRADEVVFDAGRGFGHGMGLCQWGAEGRARAGQPAGAILRHYYPGARIVRAY
jgi:stage II sporulation protein D